MIDREGRIVLAGLANSHRAIVRLTAAGGPDAFGDSGMVVVTDGVFDFFSDLLTLADGRIAVLGHTPNADVHVFTADGGLDTTYSDDGRLALNSSYMGLVEFGGDLIATGNSMPGVGSDGFDAYRMSLTDGTLVTGFDGDGIARIEMGEGSSATFNSAVDREGRLVIVGSWATASRGNVVLVRVWL